jgi:hypothetical protein
VGVISYGIYLWHWPIIVWLDAREADGWGRVGLGALAIGLTLLIAWLSFRLVEQPIRTGRWTKRLHSQRPAWERRVVLASVPLALLMVAGVSLAATTTPPVDTSRPVIMLTGDSVPQHLEVAMEAAALDRGWQMVSAAAGGCPVTGERPTNMKLELVGAGEMCPVEVVSDQDALIDGSDPDIVVWWDRWSLSPFVTPSGAIVDSRTDEFWKIRASTLRTAVDRLTRDGARVLFVATEPPGQAMAADCAAGVPGWCPNWHRYLLAHYEDLTRRWNGMLATYAHDHPEQASFLSVTDLICHTDVAPCDDTIDGEPARPDGTHYEGAGQDRVVDYLISFLRNALASRSTA